MCCTVGLCCCCFIYSGQYLQSGHTPLLWRRMNSGQVVWWLPGLASLPSARLVSKSHSRPVSQHPCSPTRLAARAMACSHWVGPPPAEAPWTLVGFCSDTFATPRLPSAPPANDHAETHVQGRVWGDGGLHYLSGQREIQS